MVATLILILSAAMFLFYFQATCQTILRREFDREYFRSIVSANGLEFPSLRKALQDSSQSVDFDRIREGLSCDFLTLTYLLKRDVRADGSYLWDVRLLVLYFHVVYLLMLARHVLRLGENSAVMNLTSILQHLSNLAGLHLAEGLAHRVPAKVF